MFLFHPSENHTITASVSHENGRGRGSDAYEYELRHRYVLGSSLASSHKVQMLPELDSHHTHDNVLVQLDTELYSHALLGMT